MSERESNELFPFLPGRWSAVFLVAALGVCTAASYVAIWAQVAEPLRGPFAWVLVGLFAWVGAMTIQRRAVRSAPQRERLWRTVASGLGIAAAGAFVLGHEALGVAPMSALLAALVWTTLTGMAPPPLEVASGDDPGKAA